MTIYNATESGLVELTDEEKAILKEARIESLSARIASLNKLLETTTDEAQRDALLADIQETEAVLSSL